MTETSPETSSETTRVVVVGDALIDELRDARESRSFPGGAALNVAVGLALLGVPTTLIAMLGDDADGTLIREYLASHGVTLLATPAPLGTSRAISDRTEGEPRYDFNQAAKQRRIEFGAEERAALAAASLVVVSCFPFDDTEQTDALAAAVTDPERRLVIDPNPRSGMLADRALFVANFERLAGRSLLTKAGDEDAELLNGSTLDALRDRLVGLGARTVLATAGRHGAAVVTADGLLVIEPIAVLPGPVVDTMGAGDATLAASVATLVHHGVPTDVTGWQELLADAMRTAAATCRHEGALLRLP